MEIYLLLLLVLLFLNAIEILYRNKTVVWLSGFILAVFAGIRFYTGYDFISYQNYFNQATTISNISEMADTLERGYLYLVYIFNLIGLNYYTFVLFISFLSIGLLTYFLYTNFEYPTAALSFYYARFYILRDMAQVRSSLAAIILLFSLKYIKERQLVKFLVIVFIASLFHIASLVFILAYILNVLIDRLTLYNTTFFLLTAMLIGILIQYPELYENYVPQRFISYVTAPSWMGAPWFLNPIVYMQLLILMGSYLCSSNIISSQEKLENQKIYLHSYFLASLALISTNTMRVMGGRVSTFFATLEILIVPNTLLNLTKNKLLNLLMFSVFTIIIFVLIFIVSGRYSAYIPYQTPFNFY